MGEIKIFIVEDDPMVLSINCQFVEKIHGFAIVGTARSGNSAIEKIKNINPDLILLDIFIPEINGLEIAKRIRAENISSDIIMITAATDAHTVSASLRLGVVDYIIKPFNFARFKEALERYKNRFYNFNRKEFNQESIDNLTTSYLRTYDMDKGIDRETYNKIKNYVINLNMPITAEKLSELMGISRITARRYLEYLVQEGLLSIENQNHGRGRPEKLYSIRLIER